MDASNPGDHRRTATHDCPISESERIRLVLVLAEIARNARLRGEAELAWSLQESMVEIAAMLRPRQVDGRTPHDNRRWLSLTAGQFEALANVVICALIDADHAGDVPEVRRLAPLWEKLYRGTW